MPGVREVNYSPAMASPVPTAWMHCLVAATLFVVLWLLYQQSFAFDYVYFDDAEYVIENPMVMGGLTWDGVFWALTSFHMGIWHPLTWLSHMLDVSLFGVEPRAAHIHNTLLHGLNSALVYALLLRYRATWLQAALLALIFLVHPLHIESVAWIAERKDLLCALFFFAGLLAYDNYRSSPRASAYLLVLGCLILALLSKPMAVSFPVVLLLLDILVYRNGNQRENQPEELLYFLWRTLFEKIPLIGITAAACAITILSQDSGGAVAYLESHSLTNRLETAFSAYLIYTKQWLLPTNLIAFYPLNVTGKTSAWVIPLLSVITACFVAALFAKSRPNVTLGLAWYVITLLPVVGLVQVGSQAHADRYMYLPSVGLLIFAIGLFPSAKSKQLRTSHALTIVFIAYLSVLCYWQIGAWRNEHTLFQRVLDVAGPNRMAHLHLAKDYIRRGMLNEATTHSIATIELSPNSPGGYQALGNIALERQQFPEAEKYFLLALKKGPAVGNVVNNLGITLAEQGDIDAANRAFKKALEIDPFLQAAKANLLHYQQKLEAVNPK